MDLPHGKVTGFYELGMRSVEVTEPEVDLLRSADWTVIRHLVPYLQVAE
jgi:hypothetical protein